MRPIRAIYLYLIPIRIYRIVISKRNMIQCEHCHTLEIVQNNVFQTLLNNAVSENKFKGPKIIFGYWNLLASLSLISRKVRSTTSKPGRAAPLDQLSPLSFQKMQRVRADPIHKDLMLSRASFCSVILQLRAAPRGSQTENTDRPLRAGERSLLIARKAGT